jgi:hypothetical protein
MKYNEFILDEQKLNDMDIQDNPHDQKLKKILIEINDNLSKCIKPIYKFKLYTPTRHSILSKKTTRSIRRNSHSKSKSKQSNISKKKYATI